MQPRLMVVETEEQWRLDERTRAIGLQGVARARRALSRPAGRHHPGKAACQDETPCTVVRGRSSRPPSPLF